MHDCIKGWWHPQWYILLQQQLLLDVLKPTGEDSSSSTGLVCCRAESRSWLWLQPYSMIGNCENKAAISCRQMSVGR